MGPDRFAVRVSSWNNTPSTIPDWVPLLLKLSHRDGFLTIPAMSVLFHRCPGLGPFVQALLFSTPSNLLTLEQENVTPRFTRASRVSKRTTTIIKQRRMKRRTTKD